MGLAELQPNLTWDEIMRQLKAISGVVVSLCVLVFFAQEQAYSADKERLQVTKTSENRYRFKSRGIEQRVRILIKSRQMHGTFTEMEIELPEGGQGPGMHLHENYQTFHVLQGQLTLLRGNHKKPFVIEEGMMVILPPGVMHNYRNDSSSQVTFLTSIIQSDRSAPTVKMDNMYIEFSGVFRRNLPDDQNEAALEDIRKKYLMNEYSGEQHGAAGNMRLRPVPLLRIL